MLSLEWDEAKRASNLRKHKIDFDDPTELFEGELYTKMDVRFDYGETRFVTFGVLDGEILAVAHTENESVIRVISARRANRHEQKEYFEKIRD